MPERSDWANKFAYEDQISWELNCLKNCDKILFWVPREMKTMPALTTNVEFGYWLAKRPNDICYGRPVWSEKNGYLDYLYFKETNKTPKDNLKELLLVTGLI